jgi:hypothetical protein
MTMTLELYRAIQHDAGIQEMEIDNRKYTTGPLHPLKEPVAECLEVTTLTGLVDYLEGQFDAHNIKDLFCHVQAPKEVTIRSGLIGDFKQRDAVIKAKLNFDHFEFSRWYDAEKFNIALQTFFVNSETRALLLKYVGNMMDSHVTEYGDDGVTQKITTKVGIADVKNVILPNPVKLRPYRTFSEVEQPESLFVFRGKKSDNGPVFALFEADNGAWRGEAMQNIKQYMKEHVADLYVVA